jgi:hypothetical protein
MGALAAAGSVEHSGDLSVDNTSPFGRTRFAQCMGLQCVHSIASATGVSTAFAHTTAWHAIIMAHDVLRPPVCNISVQHRCADR